MDLPRDAVYGRSSFVETMVFRNGEEECLASKGRVRTLLIGDVAPNFGDG